MLRPYKLVAETDNKQASAFTIYHYLAISAVKENKAGGGDRVAEGRVSAATDEVVRDLSAEVTSDKRCE